MKKLIGVFLLLSANNVLATKVPHVPLQSLVQEADLIVHVLINSVQMTDRKGQEIKDSRTMTGPGRGNILILVGQVLNGGVLKQNAAVYPDEIPSQISVKLMQEWHYSLEDIVESELNTEAIWLLKGNNFEAVYPELFNRSITELIEVENLIQSNN